jgi:Putative restriction endonuclease
MTTETNLPVTSKPASASSPGCGANGDAAYEIPAWAIPDYDKIVIEDNTPVESLFAEKQYRLLTEPLYASWPGLGEGRTFGAFSNVGLFSAKDKPPVVPDVMLSLDFKPGDLSQREHNSYFIWEVGGPPDVVIELVSDRRGGEDSDKKAHYARIGVSYYVIFDPDNVLGPAVLRSFERRGSKYYELTDHWFPDVGLGVKLWEGACEGFHDHWLRWCTRDGQMIATGVERIAQERDRADRINERMERLAAQLRALGQEPTA